MVPGLVMFPLVQVSHNVCIFHTFVLNINHICFLLLVKLNRSVNYVITLIWASMHYFIPALCVSLENKYIMLGGFISYMESYTATIRAQL